MLYSSGGSYRPETQLFPYKYLRGVKEGRSLSYRIFPFPSGEGDQGDGASTIKQGAMYKLLFD